MLDSYGKINQYCQVLAALYAHGRVKDIEGLREIANEDFAGVRSSVGAYDLDVLMMDEVNRLAEVYNLSLSEDYRGVVWWYHLNSGAAKLANHSRINRFFEKMSKLLSGGLDGHKMIMTIYQDLFRDIARKEAEVITPMPLVQEMLDALPKDIWSDKSKTFLDPCCGSGSFLVAIFYRLMDGLADVIPDEKERAKHILDNQIYGYDNEWHQVFLASVFLSAKYNIPAKNVGYIKDSLTEKWGDMKFDVVVGNPPYQGQLVNGQIKSTKPVYPDFVSKSLKLTHNYVLMITPHKWTSGSNLSDFKKIMVNSSGLKLLKRFSESQMIFGPNVHLKGGVSYFLCQKGYKGDFTYLELNQQTVLPQNEEALTRFYSPAINSILSKVKNCAKYDSIYKRNSNIISKDSRFNANAGIVVHLSMNRTTFIDQSAIKDAHDYGKWKVLFPRACSANHLAQKAIIAPPSDTSSESKWFLTTNSKNECDNLLNYFSTTLIKFLMSNYQASHNVNSPVLRYTPVCPDLTKPWNDQDVMAHFGITQAEQDWMVACIKNFNIDEC